MKTIKKSLEFIRNLRFNIPHCFYAICIFALGACSPEEQVLQPEESLKIEKDQTLKKLNTWEDQIDLLTKKMRRFHNHQVALAQGWDFDLTGYVPQMGHHFINSSRIDDKFELDKPEALIYVPDEHGKMQFVGVEYLVTVQSLDPLDPAPEGFIGDLDVWSFNANLNNWTLHAWVGLENPNGVFKPRNPLLD